MPEYLYGCNNKIEHPRVTTVHGILDNPVLECEVCHAPMHRIPQPFLFGVSPISLIRSWSERNWSKKLRGEPVEEGSNVFRTDTGKPQKDFYARK